MRLGKFLAHAGVASRRASEQLVAEGRVKVDGEVVRNPAHGVEEDTPVTVDGRPVAPEPHEVFVLNKPKGVVSTAQDTHGRPTVVELVRSNRRLYPVGRLDADSTGLILLTNDGDLADRLTHPRYGVDKVYRARITPGRLSPRALTALKQGVELDDGMTAPARVRQPGRGVAEIVLREGRKRQVRRMFDAVGHRVTDLERVAFGPLRLRGLGPGESRLLSRADVERLRRSTEEGAGPRPAARRKRSGGRAASGWKNPRP
jgi:23S rRNA pseudouridine2605 synthase